jgi:hypothetical protein
MQRFRPTNRIFSSGVCNHRRVAFGVPNPDDVAICDGAVFKVEICTCVGEEVALVFRDGVTLQETAGESIRLYV